MPNENEFDHILDEKTISGVAHEVPEHLKIEIEKEEIKIPEVVIDEKIIKKEKDEEEKKIAEETANAEKEKDEDENEGETETEEENEDAEEVEDDNLTSMSQVRLMAEAAKLDGVFEDDFKIPTNIKGSDLYDAIDKAKETKYNDRNEKLYGKDNFALFQSFVRGELNSSEGAQVARQVGQINQLISLKTDEDNDQEKSNRVALMTHLYKNIQGLDESVVEVVINAHITKGEDVELAKDIKAKLHNYGGSLIKGYNDKIVKKDTDKQNELNAVLTSSTLEDLNLKNEKDRGILKGVLNDKTEEFTYKNKNTGLQETKKITMAERLINEGFADNEKFIAIISYLFKLNDLKDVERNLDSKKKKKIFRAMDNYTKKKTEEKTGEKSGYSALQGMIEQNRDY